MSARQRPSTEAKENNRTPAENSPVILSVAFPYAPVGGKAVGGAEVILSQIEAALQTLGFRSVVVAHADSGPHGRLYPTAVPAGEITESLRSAVEEAQQNAIDLALAQNPVALVHMQGLDFHRYRIPGHLPVLVTLHLPPAWYPEAIWSLPDRYHFVCVSETQRQACPEAVRGRIDVVPNGVPLPEAATLRPGGRYALMMARICAEKNLHTGLEAARLAGMPAVLAGEVFPYEAHERYFADKIEPRLTRSGKAHERHADVVTALAEARFLGPVTGTAKARLLARAACLLLPSLAPETSSLVAMEALAAGVPVIAMASGAVPEIVEHGHTGFLLDPQLGSGDAAAQAMASAIGRLPEIDRNACRAAAEQRFRLHPMLNAYRALYRRYALGSDQAVCVPSKPAIASETGRPDQTSLQIRDLDHVTNSEQLAALVPAWIDLWKKDPLATPFQHPAWLLPWWRQFGSDGELHSVALKNAQGDLLGFVPLYVYGSETGTRQLLLLGAGTADYLDGLFDDRDPVPLADAALTFASDKLRCRDTLSLMQLRAASPLLRTLRASGVPGEGTITEAEPCSVIDMTLDLPTKLRANIGRYQRRAEAGGSLACTVAGSAEEGLEYLEHLRRFHNDRWDERGEAGVLSDSRVQAHHRETTPALFQADLLRFFCLTLREQVIGVLYALADPPQRTQRSLYLYLIGFDTHFSALSPGTLLLHAVWQYARANGFARLDLLRGGEGYKQLWGAEQELTYSISAPANVKPDVL